VYFVFIEELFKSQETPSHLQKAVGHPFAAIKGAKRNTAM